MYTMLRHAVTYSYFDLPKIISSGSEIFNFVQSCLIIFHISYYEERKHLEFIGETKKINVYVCLYYISIIFLSAVVTINLM